MGLHVDPSNTQATFHAYSSDTWPHSDWTTVTHSHILCVSLWHTATFCVWTPLTHGHFLCGLLWNMATFCVDPSDTRPHSVWISLIHEPHATWSPLTQSHSEWTPLTHGHILCGPHLHGHIMCGPLLHGHMMCGPLWRGHIMCGPLWHTTRSVWTLVTRCHILSRNLLVMYTWSFSTF
jgi:hypothetical protein